MRSNLRGWGTLTISFISDFGARRKIRLVRVKTKKNYFVKRNVTR